MASEEGLNEARGKVFPGHFGAMERRPYLGLRWHDIDAAYHGRSL
jgi:hypothetical protein